MVTFTELADPTLGELRRALLRDTFHVLHYMGHGGFDEQQGGVLLFTDRAGRGMPVTAGTWVCCYVITPACAWRSLTPARPDAPTRLTRSPGWRTHWCAGASPRSSRCSSRSATSGDEFAPALYGALAAGRPVDAAVAEARKAMYTVSPLEWATPVLYLRADDALLFDITAGVTSASGPLQRM